MKTRADVARFLRIGGCPREALRAHLEFVTATCMHACMYACTYLMYACMHQCNVIECQTGMLVKAFCNAVLVKTLCNPHITLFTISCPIIIALFPESAKPLMKINFIWLPLKGNHINIIKQAFFAKSMVPGKCTSQWNPVSHSGCKFDGMLWKV